MKYLFDSSAIFIGIKENKVDDLIGNYTLDLARYELGNIIWKNFALQAITSEQESKKMARAIKHTLNKMELLGAEGSEEEILEIAAKLKLTFYGASYVYFAKTKQLLLITQDLRLIKKVTSTINVSTLEGIE